MRIFLVGFMASGKSTVGPKVAAHFDLAFADLDDVIARRAGQTIPELFAAEGESGFRERESDALRAVAKRNDIVVALGGGTFVDPDNRAVALQAGTVVYLDVPPETILSRVAGEADQRPLLQDDAGQPLPRAAMATRIRDLLCTRRPAYTTADAIVDASAAPDDVAAAVVGAVRDQQQ